MNDFTFPLMDRPGRAGEDCDAAVRCDFSIDNSRESTAAAIVGTGTCKSSAALIVHVPVPFMPTTSKMFSTSGEPGFSGSA